jgi:pimeloyl-ACP methyl ester carboxylesterase
MRPLRSTAGLIASLLTALVLAAPAQAEDPPPGGVAGVPVPRPAWSDCGEGFQCATATVPRDYREPSAGTFELALIRRPARDRARRIGSLFLNPGGPGGSGVDLVRQNADVAFAPLNERFDLVGFDPRGVGASRPVVDCFTDPENEFLSRRPYPRPEGLSVKALRAGALVQVDRCLSRNPGVLPYVGTANVARDLDLLRAAVGDPKLTYLGFSYGTAIGATYASLFGRRSRALVLDGAVQSRTWHRDPIRGAEDQTAAFERALERFFAACAAGTPSCAFGEGRDPRATFEALLALLDAAPLRQPDGRLLRGDDLRLVALVTMYHPDLWKVLDLVLTRLAAGDGSLARQVADIALGRDENGHFDGLNDRFFAIWGVDGDWPNDTHVYARLGRRAPERYPHFFANTGFSLLPFGKLPVRPRGIFRGPYRQPAAAPTALVVGSRHDPATPYSDAVALTRELGNARLLTMDGDGHTAAFNGISACVDVSVLSYLVDLRVPPDGTVCPQSVQAFPPAQEGLTARTRRLLERVGPVPVPRPLPVP